MRKRRATSNTVATLVGLALLVPGLAQAGDAETTSLLPPPRERVDIGKSLMITDLRVVEDPVRTNPRNGPLAVWSFAQLIRNMAGRQDPSDLTLRWLRQWETDQIVNGRVSRARPSIRRLVIDPWLRASGGNRLDLNKAPFKLLAIVNRMDLRQQDRARVESAGEGRFVFGVLGADGKPLPPLGGNQPGGFLVIFEYELVARSMDELKSWAEAWRDLGRLGLGSPEYNLALERVTRRFADAGKAPLKVNGSALNQLRSNEVALNAPWELREFVLEARSGQLRQHTVALTPDTIELNGTKGFADLINQNERSILDGTFDLAPAYLGAAALSGPFVAADFPDFATRTFTKNVLVPGVFNIPWSAAGIRSNDARHAVALNTCGGCHRDETATNFLQVSFPANHKLPLSLGAPAALAGFLVGIDVRDPVMPSQVRRFADLDRRRLDLEELIASFFGPGHGLGPIDTTHEMRRVH